MKTILNEHDRKSIILRLEDLRPDAERLWGTMNAPRMIAHLRDQMKHSLGITQATQEYSWKRNTAVRWLAIYVLPWPKGRLKGPKDAFVTQPGEWEVDVSELVGFLETFAATELDGPYPPHAGLGPMSRNDWGALTYKHFDHHLRQFGA